MWTGRDRTGTIAQVHGRDRVHTVCEGATEIEGSKGQSCKVCCIEHHRGGRYINTRRGRDVMARCDALLDVVHRSTVSDLRS